MAGLLRQGHFLGSKLRSLRKRNGLTLDEVSARCVQLSSEHAPSVSYLSMVETGKRVPSAQMLEVLAQVFGKDVGWFLDRTEAQPASPPRKGRGGVATVMPLAVGLPRMTPVAGLTARPDGSPTASSKIGGA